MPKYKVSDRVQVKLSGGRIIEATIKAVVETTDGVRLQVSFGDETALIYLCEIVENRTEMFQDKRRQIDAETSDGKRHLPTVLRRVTDAISKLP